MDNKYLKREESDFKLEWFSGSGKGGQHRNKHSNCIRIIHIPTGIKQEKQGRSRTSNYEWAIKEINKKLDMLMDDNANKQISQTKKEQAGSGMRGDKIRTYRFQDDQVIDHYTNKKAKCSKVMKGRIDLLWINKK